LTSPTRPSASRIVRDDPWRPDPGFAELYASLPDATDLWPWKDLALEARQPVLYLGIGAGRLAVPLHEAGVALVGVDSHPGMLESLRRRLPDTELIQSRIEDLDLGRRFHLVIVPSNILCLVERLRAAAMTLEHAQPAVGRPARVAVHDDGDVARGHEGVLPPVPAIGERGRPR